jgi:hypothetical protein
MTHSFTRLPGYPWPICRECYALAPNNGPCVRGRIAAPLGPPTDEERARDAAYLAEERKGIRCGK